MKKIFYLIAMIMPSSLLFSQEEKENNIGMTYATEGQYNLDNDRANWVNLLNVQGRFATESIGGWTNGAFEIELISIYKTSKDRVAGDMQTFSNIEADNLPLGIFTLGYAHKLNKVEVFGGIRNVNRDYFTTPYTSLFTNSSCGIYPTLSDNFPVANYPLSAMCLHVEYCITDNLILKNSLYNGVAHGYEDFYRHLFTVNPYKDGIFNMMEFNYINTKKNYGNYNFGIAVYSRMDYYDMEAEKEIKKANNSIWGSIEQNIYNRGERHFGVLLQGGCAPSDRNPCSAYYAVGGVVSGLFSTKKQDQLGVIANRAIYDHISETAIEVTYKYSITTSLHLQPAFHYIKTGTEQAQIPMLRVIYIL